MIHFVISSSWVRLHKRKLLRCQLQARDVINKPNLDVILQFDLGNMDILGLHTSHDYLSQFKKHSFAMIQQLGPPTFFVIFTTAESK